MSGAPVDADGRTVIDERPLEQALSKVLSAGSLLSLALFAVVIAVFLSDPVVRGEDVGALLAHPPGGVGRVVAFVACALLVATPVARVVVTFVVFVRRRDLVFVAWNAIVLAVIAAAIVLGRAAG